MLINYCLSKKEGGQVSSEDQLIIYNSKVAIRLALYPKDTHPLLISIPGVCLAHA